MILKIGKHIKALRKRDDVTQERLAEALGVTSQAISKWENETGYPDIEYLVPIANFFNVTIDELFDHHKAEKERKITEYCEAYDAMYRDWAPVEERISIMRQALAEFPAEEKLLVRLATALWYKWCDDDFDRYSQVNGKWVHDTQKHRAHKGWEEPAKIMEELLATSVDDTVRYECRDTLIRLYGWIGEKERVYQLAEFCPDCKAANLFAAFNGVYEKEARENSQSLIQGALARLRIHLPRQTQDVVLKAKTIEKLIDLHEFVFDDGNYAFVHVKMENLYVDLADALIRQDRPDEAMAALEKAYEHAKQFDLYLDRLRRDGEVRYTSTFADVNKDLSTDVYATKAVPELLEYTLLDQNDIYYRTFKDDPSFNTLIQKIKNEMNE